MKLNMGPVDRKLRLYLVAPILVVTGLLIGPGGILPTVLYVVAAVMAGTSLAGSCPLYSLLGLRTCPVSSAQKPPADAGVSR